MGQAPDPEDRLRAAQAERARLHRLSPSKPLQDADDAAAFVRERRIVTETGHAAVPCLAHTIAGRELVGSWMASPEVHRIYDLLSELSTRDLCSASLLDGKVTIFDPSLAPAVHRLATDPERQDRLVSELPPQAARLRLERLLLVVTEEIHTDRGSHTVALRPWSESRVARMMPRTVARPSLAESMDLLLEAAVASAVVAPERGARKWFDFAGERLDALVERGLLERLITAPRQCWLVPAGVAAG